MQRECPTISAMPTATHAAAAAGASQEEGSRRPQEVDPSAVADGATEAASGRQRQGAQEDERPQRRLRAAQRGHPQLGFR